MALTTYSYGQVVLTADGPGATYERIDSLLNNGYRACETPDCSHAEFGRHITEHYDHVLDDHVFKFMIHKTHDTDRCKNMDRQRCEIKANGHASEAVLGREDEKITYQWKFKLENNFSASSRFTHIHQITYKRIQDSSRPLFALTVREKERAMLQVNYISPVAKEKLAEKPLSLFTGKWIVAEETIHYAARGSYELKLYDLSGKVLLNVQKNGLLTWFEEMDYTRPKWGLYRSLKKVEALKDETMLLADLSIDTAAN